MPGVGSVPPPKRMPAGSTPATPANWRRRIGLGIALFFVLGIVGAIFEPHQQQPQGIPGGRYGAICRDGWQSASTGSGTCSHHGGVAEWLVYPAAPSPTYRVAPPMTIQQFCAGLVYHPFDGCPKPSLTP